MYNKNIMLPNPKKKNDETNPTIRIPIIQPDSAAPSMNQKNQRKPGSEVKIAAITKETTQAIQTTASK